MGAVHALGSPLIYVFVRVTPHLLNPNMATNWYCPTTLYLRIPTLAYVPKMSLGGS